MKAAPVPDEPEPLFPLQAGWLSGEQKAKQVGSKLSVQKVTLSADAPLQIEGPNPIPHRLR